MSRATGTTKVPASYRELIETQKELFRILEEFFERATGSKPAKFAALEKFGEEIKKNAQRFASRSVDAFNFVYSALPDFYDKHGKESFTNAGTIGGLKFVIGGQSRFTLSHLDSVRRVALYTDTILIPDPILPWLEVPRTEERFREVEFLQAAFNLLQLKPLADVDLAYPAILVFPSWEKTLENRDRQTQAHIESLTCGVLSREVGRKFESLGQLFAYAKEHENEFLGAIEQRRIFIGPGGSPGQSLAENVELYRQHMKEWRTDQFLADAAMLSTGELVARGLAERIAPQSHLLENAEELAANPMLCLEQHWFYYKLCTGYFEQRLKDRGLLSNETIADVRAINQPQLEWLGNIPIESLAQLRLNNENEEFRSHIRGFTKALNEAELGDLDRVTAEVSRGIASLLMGHQKRVRQIDEEYRKRYKKTALATWVSAAALMIPSLAPFLPALSAGTAALKYLSDKIDERNARKEHAKSLLGVLAAASDTQND
jgi:hypothetical protein